MLDDYMKNKIIIILSIVIVCCLIGFLGFKLLNKKSDDFIESVQNVYASAGSHTSDCSCSGTYYTYNN